MKSRMIQSYLINQRTLVIPLFVAVVMLINSITPQNPAISLRVEGLGILLLIIGVFVRGWLEQKYNVVREYSFLMVSYNKYCLSKSSEVTNPDLASQQGSRKDFNGKQSDIDRQFKELHNILTKSISSWYYLIKTDTVLIGNKYAMLIGDTKTLYEDFQYSIDSEFILALKNSRERFPEIKNAISEDLLSFDTFLNIN